jgi:hypothetical protein
MVRFGSSSILWKYSASLLGSALKTALLLTCLTAHPLPSMADPGYLWLEPGPQMQRRGGGQGLGMGTDNGAEASRTAVHGDRPSGHPHGASGPGDGHRPRMSDPAEEKRAAMSQPAHYTLRLGWPPAATADDDASEILRNAGAAILRPDLSDDQLTPIEEAPGNIRIRDAALLQGRYYVTAAAAVREGDTFFRLYTQAQMRNTGHPLQGPPASDAPAPRIDPLLTIEDLSPDPGDNFARIHRRYTGETLPLRIRLVGEPVKDLPVTLTTGSGWRQTLATDDKGEVCFTIIKEQFHSRKTPTAPTPFFVTVEVHRPADAAEDGLRQEVLRSALALTVHPTPLEWESQAAGFYTLTTVGVAIALATALRRRRRGKFPCV